MGKQIIEPQNRTLYNPKRRFRDFFFNLEKQAQKKCGVINYTYVCSHPRCNYVCMSAESTL